MKNSGIMGLYVFLLAIALITMAVICNNYRNKYHKLQKVIERRDNTELRLQGSTKLYGDKGFDNPMLNYYLRSWDGGKNWYVIDQEIYFRFGEVKVLGEAETIYPGLIKHLRAWDKLTNYVVKDGPLDPTDIEDLQLMEEAGFKIENK